MTGKPFSLLMGSALVAAIAGVPLMVLGERRPGEALLAVCMSAVLASMAWSSLSTGAFHCRGAIYHRDLQPVGFWLGTLLLILMAITALAWAAWQAFAMLQ